MALLGRRAEAARHQLVFVVDAAGDAVHAADEGVAPAAHHAEADARGAGFRCSVDWHLVSPLSDPEHPAVRRLVHAGIGEIVERLFGDTDDVILDELRPFTRAVLGVPPVDTREVETSVLVDNGETLVLGGIYERETLDETDRVPFFGELPLVEHLFKTTRKSDDKAELLIFVTPKIVKESFTL